MATALRSEPRSVLVERLRADFEQMEGIHEALTEDDWSNLIVSHFYMGPLPAFFYPAFQLMDYGVHSWDVRQGTGRAHGLSGEVGDLLVPFMFVLWKYTVAPSDPSPASSASGSPAGRMLATPASPWVPAGWTTRRATCPT